MSKEINKIIVPEKSSSVDDIQKVFKNSFWGICQVIYSKDKKYLVIIHDIGSGTVLENLYIYKHEGDGWTLIGSILGCRQICDLVETDATSIRIMAKKNKLIASFSKN